MTLSRKNAQRTGEWRRADRQGFNVPVQSIGQCEPGDYRRPDLGPHHGDGRMDVAHLRPRLKLELVRLHGLFQLRLQQHRS